MASWASGAYGDCDGGCADIAVAVLLFPDHHNQTTPYDQKLDQDVEQQNKAKNNCKIV